MKRGLLCLLTAFSLVWTTAAIVRAQDVQHTAAVFVKNHADNVPDEKVAALEDLITGHLSDKGFRVISRDDVMNAVSNFATEGTNKGGASPGSADIDKIISDSASALRLSQMLGADCILVASIDSFTDDQVAYNDPDSGIQTTIDEYKLTVAYRLVDAVQGGSVTGGEIDAVKKDRAQPGLTIHRDYLSNLIDDAGGKLSDALIDKFNEGRVAELPQASNQMAAFSVNCSMGDLTVPEVDKDEDGNYIVTGNRYKVEALNVTVAVDGVVVGTTPGPFKVMPGLHKVHLTRDGFNDWTEMVAVHDGMTLNVDLELSPDGYARWQDTSAFLQGLKENDKLTEARVQVLQGRAQELAQSGFRVDDRTNINVSKNVDINKNIKSDIHEDNTAPPQNNNTEPAPPPTSQPAK